MRKLLLIVSTMIMPLLAFAGGIPLLDKVDGHRVSFHYTYLLSTDGKPMEAVTDGDVLLEDNAYRLQGLGLEIISDGLTRWSRDPEAEEVVVEKVEKEDLFTNPALFIRSYRQYMDKLKVNSSGPDSLDVTLTLDEGTTARFVLTGIKFFDRQGTADFFLDVASLPKSYVVTDLR